MICFYCGYQNVVSHTCPSCGKDLESGNYPKCYYGEELSHYKRGRKKRSTEQFAQHAEFVQWLKDSGIKRTTIKTYVSGVKRYFDFLNNKLIPLHGLKEHESAQNSNLKKDNSFILHKKKQ